MKLSSLYKHFCRFFSWQVLLALSLITSSAILYVIHYMLFREAHHIFLYLVGDIAFVPLEVLFVTLILHRLLEQRAKKEKLNKLNMVIGAFFSEIGTELMMNIAGYDKNAVKIHQRLHVTSAWDTRTFKEIHTVVSKYTTQLTLDRKSLSHLKTLLAEKRDFILSLLQNPNLLEHESFTDLLWAVFHLIEELSHRKQIRKISDKDKEHLINDIHRSYLELIKEWLHYMQHLQKDYPYLFSFALRTNPFDPDARVEF